LKTGEPKNTMEIKNFIQEELAFIQFQCDTITQGLTDAQFNWKPPGTTNPMSAIFIHMTGAEDDFIQAVLCRRLPIWEAEAWPLKIGVAAYPMPGQGWKEFSTDSVRLAPVLAYAKVVRAATLAYLATLTVEGLDHKTMLFGEEKTTAQVLNTLVAHSAGHIGEMATIKGLQGFVALPY
jgi:hypothetical protein